MHLPHPPPGWSALWETAWPAAIVAIVGAVVAAIVAWIRWLWRGAMGLVRAGHEVRGAGGRLGILDRLEKAEDAAAEIRQDLGVMRTSMAAVEARQQLILKILARIDERQHGQHDAPDPS